MRQFDAAIPVRHILLMDRIDALKMLLQGLDHCLGEHRDPVLVPFPFADDDLSPLEIQILDSQSERLEQSQTAAVEQHPDEPLVAAEVRHDP